MKNEILISLNKDFHEDCIFDFAEQERKTSRYKHLLTSHFSEIDICDGKPYTYLDYEDLELYQFEDLEEEFSSYISYKDYYSYESKSFEMDEISNISIDEMERLDNYYDSLIEESRYMHEYRLNKIFNYIEKKY